VSTAAPRGFIPEPFAYHAEIELTIERLTNLGWGVGRHGDWVVMAPFTAPGDRARVRVFKNHKNYSEADLVELIEPSPDRAGPACPFFGTCGGCQYQHLDYARQLAHKTDQVRELMERIGDLDTPVSPAHPSPRPYGYRSKLTPHYPRPPRELRGLHRPRPATEEELPIGFLRQGRGRDILDVPACPIATDAINAALPSARAELRARAGRLKRGGTLLLRHTLEGVTTDNKVLVSERIGQKTFQFTAGEFFQNNPFILPEMVDYVLGQATGLGGRFLVDAYCGVGVFALCGADRFERFAGIEVSAPAIRWANANAAINRVENGTFTIGNAEAIFADIDFPGEESIVIIDPPRAGCARAFIDQLLAFAPRGMVYVSCDPATQARDLKLIGEGGPYAVTALQPFDLFPQTRHIENVATLARQD
jgi:23S rRNA (uracil1939-C5)-methyltransferase/tRNA (uracil-5-)-methyltransferase